MLNINLLSCQVEKNKSIFFNCQVKMLDTISINDNHKKIMTIYHKAFNLVKRLYKNFTILLLSLVKVFHLTPKRLENCRCFGGVVPTPVPYFFYSFCNLKYCSKQKTIAFHDGICHFWKVGGLFLLVK